MQFAKSVQRLNELFSFCFKGPGKGLTDMDASDIEEAAGASEHPFHDDRALQVYMRKKRQVPKRGRKYSLSLSLVFCGGALGRSFLRLILQRRRRKPWRKRPGLPGPRLESLVCHSAFGAIACRAAEVPLIPHWSKTRSWTSLLEALAPAAAARSLNHCA